ncbi:MAG: MBOAT family O-acyltransferase, partial [Woeseia sp.]
GVLAPVVERVYGEAAAANGTDAWVGTMAFAGQIFFDFNGYSMIAVGLGKCLGFELPWNFLSPYGAIGFSDFWRRWHITLSTWLRDYLYISLSGNRAGQARTIVNLMLTMLLGGLWHGASWLFVLWGGVHGLLLVMERGARAMFENSRIAHAAPVRLLAAVATWTAICLTWVLFRAEDAAAAGSLLVAMLTFDGGERLLGAVEIQAVIVVVAALLATHWFMRNRRFETVIGNLPWPVVGLILGAMLTAMVLSPGEERDFIYFEF